MSNIVEVTLTQQLVWTELAYENRNNQSKLDQLKPLFKNLVETDAPHEQFLQLFNY